MDGEAVVAAFGSCSGPHCLRDVLHKYGQRLKVYNAMKLALGKGMVQEVRIID